MPDLDDEVLLVELEPGPEFLEVGHGEGHLIVLEGLNPVRYDYPPFVPLVLDLGLLEELPAHHELVGVEVLTLLEVDVVVEEQQLLGDYFGEEQVEVVLHVVLDENLELELAVDLALEVVVGEDDDPLVILVEHLHLGDLSQPEGAAPVLKLQLGVLHATDRRHSLPVVVHQALHLELVHPVRLSHVLLLLHQARRRHLRLPGLLQEAEVRHEAGVSHVLVGVLVLGLGG